MTYLTRWRLTRAAALLRDGTEPPGSVARRVGHSKPYALPHAFRREFGVTPGRYREEREAPGVAVSPPASPARSPASSPAGS